jgi:hypothetical protein
MSKREREIRRLMERDGDHCSICRARFTHNCRTFGGDTIAGDTVLVGECCVERLDSICTTGLYLTQQ